MEKQRIAGELVKLAKSLTSSNPKVSDFGTIDYAALKNFLGKYMHDPMSNWGFGREAGRYKVSGPQIVFSGTYSGGEADGYPPADGDYRIVVRLNENPEATNRVEAKVTIGAKNKTTGETGVEKFNVVFDNIDDAYMDIRHKFIDAVRPTLDEL